MPIVGDAEHARPDDTLSPDKTQFHQKLIFFDYVVPLLLSLVDQRRKHGDTDAPLDQEELEHHFRQHDDKVPQNHSQSGYHSDVMEAQATKVGLWVFSSRLVSPARCCTRAFVLPPICTSIISLR